MTQLNSLPDDKLISHGNLIRVYDVKRFDIKKNHVGLFPDSKDFYDYILLDVNVVSKNTFLLVNVTLENTNRGNILSVFDNINSREGVKSKVIKKYFEGHPNVFVLDM
jgi:hypothetical protein